MTQFYLDTEFNGHRGKLISLALVSPDGPEFYEVIDLATYGDYLWGAGHKFVVEPWVAMNVVPVLDKPGIHWPLFKLAFHQFIQEFDTPEVICDWNADAAHFMDLLSGIDYMSSLDFACRLTVLRTPKDDSPGSKRPHNALADARGLMEWHRREGTVSLPLVPIWNPEMRRMEFIEVTKVPEVTRRAMGL